MVWYSYWDYAASAPLSMVFPMQVPFGAIGSASQCPWFHISWCCWWWWGEGAVNYLRRFVGYIWKVYVSSFCRRCVKFVHRTRKKAVNNWQKLSLYSVLEIFTMDVGRVGWVSYFLRIWVGGITTHNRVTPFFKSYGGLGWQLQWRRRPPNT